MALAFASTILAADPTTVWEVVSDFGGWHRFIPRIVATELTGGAGRAPVGAVRILTLDDGSVARERLIGCDDDDRRLSYSLEEGHKFPVRTYLATVEVRPVTLTGGSFVGWTSRFDADAADEDRARATFERIYSVFLSALADHLQEPAPAGAAPILTEARRP